MSCKSILQEEAVVLRAAIRADDFSAAHRQMSRLGSLLPQLMRGYASVAKKHKSSRTPRWMFIGDILDCLWAGAEDDQQPDNWVSPSEVRTWIEEDREHAFTASDLSQRQKNGRGNTIVSWWDEALWLKRIMLREGLVSDNGRRGRASRWRITEDGRAMRLRLQVEGAEQIARKWYQEALSRYLPGSVRV